MFESPYFPVLLAFVLSLLIASLLLYLNHRFRQSKFLTQLIVLTATLFNVIVVFAETPWNPTFPVVLIHANGTVAPECRAITEDSEVKPNDSGVIKLKESLHGTKIQIHVPEGNSWRSVGFFILDINQPAPLRVNIDGLEERK